MILVRTCITTVLVLFLWSVPGALVFAQDEQDQGLESLLQDLTTTGAEEEGVTESVTPEEPAGGAAIAEEAPVAEVFPAVEEEESEELPASSPAGTGTAAVAHEGEESEGAAQVEVETGETGAGAEVTALPVEAAGGAAEEAESLVSEEGGGVATAEEAEVAMDEAGREAPEAVGEVAAEGTGAAAETEAVAEEEAVAAEPGGEEVAAATEGVTDEAHRLAIQEEIRRQALEVKGLKSLEEGYRDLELGKFADALKAFESALENIPERPMTRPDLARAHRGHAEADYRIALEIYRSKGDMKEAHMHAERALEHAPDYRAATLLLQKIEARQKKLEELAKKPIPIRKRPEVVKRKRSVKELLREGRQYYEVGDYDSAEALFDQVLIRDEYNTDAMRFLKKIEERRTQAATYHRETTVQKAVRKVRDSWNPPVTKEVELPPQMARREVVETKTATQRLQEKMAKIIIPSIEFRQANIRDVVNFLVEASVAGDPQGEGVNIILNIPQPAGAGTGGAGGQGGQSISPEEEAGLGDFGFPEEQVSEPVPSEGSINIPTVTLNLRRISLLDALKIITEVAGLRYRLEGNVVIITPVGYAAGPIVTRMYPVQPSILDVVIEKKEKISTEERSGEFIPMESTQTKMRRSDVKDFFEKAGVPFPVGTSITYNPAISQLIVANTPENLEIFERILGQLNVIPKQVEIEAKFVELGERQLEEMGLEWILTDNWELATKKNGAPVSGRERIQVDKDTQGFTKGLRFFGFDRATAAIEPVSAATRGVGQTVLGNILSISTVLTNPEVQMIVHALSQRGGIDLLSAPRVTTRSGVNAQIQVVKEIIYPTEFEVTQPTIQSEGNLVTPPTVTPGGFETRETGVILNVTPTVGPDGYTIDLTLAPEVSELVGWIQYGSEVTLPMGDQGSDRTFVFNIPQPVFSSRNVTTSIVIWDGQTVVMGGLIREDMVTVNDKVPILGDIPLLGYLFRSKGHRSEKRNLLIFVTARLVDPAGRPIHKVESVPLPGAGTAAPAEQTVAK